MQNQKDGKNWSSCLDGGGQYLVLYDKNGHWSLIITFVEKLVLFMKLHNNKGW